MRDGGRVDAGERGDPRSAARAHPAVNAVAMQVRALLPSAADSFAEHFHYRVEIPLESAPEGKTQLSDAVKIGPSPVGKAMRFEHRGAYDDIDSTYDAITAYVDEKGVDAQEIFIEEYPTDLTSSEDPNTVVLIDVMLK